MTKRIAILIDGSNFYFKLKNLNLSNQLKFDFKALNDYLVESNVLVSATYYIGAVKTDGSKKLDRLLSSQQKLLNHLLKCDYRYSLGYLLKSDKGFSEKGVDVSMAVDILINSYENLVDKIILLSSDTDLIPAIKQSRKLGKLVEYIGFSHLPSRALERNCNTFKLFDKKDLLRFLL